MKVEMDEKKIRIFIIACDDDNHSREREAVDVNCKWKGDEEKYIKERDEKEHKGCG